MRSCRMLQRERERVGALAASRGPWQDQHNVKKHYIGVSHNCVHVLLWMIWIVTYLRAHTRACTRAHAHTHTHTRTHTHTTTHTHTHTHTHTLTQHTCMLANPFTYTLCTCKRTHMHTYIFICGYTPLQPCFLLMGKNKCLRS